MIKLQHCETGRVYRVQAQHFQYAVFNGYTGFIGLRTSFGKQHLHTEHHYYTLDDKNQPGTVMPIEMTTTALPPDIQVRECFGIIDKATGKEVTFGDDGWMYTDTYEKVIGVEAEYVVNQPLLTFFENFLQEMRRQ